MLPAIDDPVARVTKQKGGTWVPPRLRLGATSPNVTSCITYSVTQVNIYFA
jgi:hypothetical protein